MVTKGEGSMETMTKTETKKVKSKFNDEFEKYLKKNSVWKQPSMA